MKILLILAKTPERQKLNVYRSVLFFMKTRVSLKHFVSASLLKPFFDSISPHILSNLTSLIDLVT